jgi:hypothetical protein
VIMSAIAPYPWICVFYSLDVVCEILPELLVFLLKGSERTFLFVSRALASVRRSIAEYLR